MSDSEQPTVPAEQPAPAEEQPAPETDSQPVEQPSDEQPPTTEESQPEPPPSDEQPATEEPSPPTDEQPSSEPQAETQPEEQPKDEEGETAAAPTATESDETAGGDETEGDKKEDECVTEEVEEVKEEPVIITPEGNPLWLSDEDVLAKGLPESEVENFKHFYFKQTHSIQAWYETLKDFAFQTEFITLSKEEIEALSVEGDPSDDQQAVLTALEDRVNQAIELYGEDGALVRVNGRSPKDAVLDRNEEAFIEEIRDAVANELEVAKQAANAYAIWKDQQHHPGVFKRGIDKIRRSFRRSRAHSTGRREAKPKLEEEEKKDEEAKPEGETEGEAKPEGEAESKPAEEGGAEVTIEVDVEGGGDEDKSEDKPAEEAQPEEKPAEETPAEPEETAPEPEAEAPKDEETPAPKEDDTPAPKEDDTPAPKEEDGEIQKVEEGDKTGEEEAKEEEKPAPTTPKKKSVREHHQHPKAKAEPQDNQILRAFLRVTGSRYRVSNGKEALEFVRKSGQIRRDLNQLKAFGGVEGVQVSMSVAQWQEQVPLYNGMCFRGFVYKNELTALSQVNDSVYFPNVDYYKSTIQYKVQEFFKENIQESLKQLENYIIDFFVAPEKVYVTRLNPFYTNIGACLFVWSEHGRVLTQGPFEFRIVETPKTAPDGYSSFQPHWATMFDSVLQQKRNERRQTRSCVLL